MGLFLVQKDQPPWPVLHSQNSAAHVTGPSEAHSPNSKWGSSTIRLRKQNINKRYLSTYTLSPLWGKGVHPLKDWTRFTTGWGVYRSINNVLLMFCFLNLIVELPHLEFGECASLGPVTWAAEFWLCNTGHGGWSFWTKKSPMLESVIFDKIFT